MRVNLPEMNGPIQQILATVTTLTLATTNPQDGPHAAPLYFVADERLNLYFFSDPGSRHCQDLAQGSLAAAAIYPEVQGWRAIRGLQLQGQVDLVESGAAWDAAWRLYQYKFPFVRSLRAVIARNQLYVFIPTWMRLVDNSQGLGYKREYRINDATVEQISKDRLPILGNEPKSPHDIMDQRNLTKAALCGEPSYVWRAGQERRLGMILAAAGVRAQGRVLENGCGVGMYVERLARHAGSVIGLEYDFERCLEARQRSERITNAAGEGLPFAAGSFDLILSHEVIEHVQDDRLAVAEMVRTLKPGGRAVIFCPNRGYPFETHGIYWHGKYKFGNIPLVNWLPRRWRDRLAPHVRVYSSRDMQQLFAELPVHFIERTVIFGAYDNLIARFGSLGRMLRALLQFLEQTPLRGLGLSHYWVVEKIDEQ